MGRWNRFFLPVLLLFVFPFRIEAQGSLPSPQAAAGGQTNACQLELPDFSIRGTSIFTDQQEQDLSDALAELYESNMKVNAPGANDELTRIGQKLLATLPPTGMTFRFRVYESGEINAFGIGGGHVYMSRKLIAAVKNEDELAGVLAHEIGHIVAHQTGIDFSRAFRVRMGVTQVGDRADIFAKVHRFFDTPEKPTEFEDTERKDQLVADRIGLYALTQAGYSAESFASFLNESMSNKGKTGNWLSDAFGLTHEPAQRYRTALKLIAELPAGCRARTPGASASFTAWHESLLASHVEFTASNVSDDVPLTLDPPLRPSLWRIRFSRDGKYILGQDDGGITVVDRVNAKTLFRIKAPDVNAAHFTPDSTKIAFTDSKLRVERWDIATQKLASFKEMVVYDGCTQVVLTSDGNTLVCVSGEIEEGAVRVGLRLIDVDTGNIHFDKKKFYEVTAMNNWWNYSVFWDAVASGEAVAGIHTSPDGHWLLVTVGPNVQAFEMPSGNPVKLGGKLKDLHSGRMCFYGDNKFVAVGEPKGDQGLYEASILNFPTGEQVKSVILGTQSISPVSRGEKVIVSPLKEYEAGIYDPDSGKFLSATRLSAIDSFDDTIAMEETNGSLLFGTLGLKNDKRVALPISQLPGAKASYISRDGKFLAYSLRNRASVWNLTTGKRVYLSRPWRSVWIGEDDLLYAQSPKYLDKDPLQIRSDLAKVTTTELGKYEGTDWQYHDLQYRLHPMGKDQKASTNHHATLEVKKFGDAKVLWTRDFPHEAPAIWPTEDSRMLLAFDMSSDEAKEQVKASPQLQKETTALLGKKKGLLLDVVDSATGVTQQAIVLPDADLTGGSNDERTARLSGDYVLVRGEHINTVIYRVADASKVGEFCGVPMAYDAPTGLIAAENRDNEILLVEEHTGKELRRFTLGAEVLVARIVGGATRQLLVLTSDQVLHRIPLPKAEGGAVAQAVAAK